jgi:lactoylglutathione lyase
VTVRCRLKEVTTNRAREEGCEAANDPIMKAVFNYAAPYADDAMNLPVANVEAAIPYYEETFGFRVLSRQDSPHKSVILARDQIQIGLAENGGDPTQEGCFFAVDNIDAAFEEIKGKPPADSDLRLDKVGDVSHRVFFVVAPDGLCYMIGERQE